MKKLSKLLMFMFCKGAIAYDLSYAYQQALNYNADYLKQIASTSASQEEIKIARSQLLPQLSVGASLTEGYFNSSGISALYHQPVYTANLQQVIFDWSKYSGYSKGKYATQVGQLQLDNAKQQLMFTVSQAYFDVLYAQDTLQAIQKTKEALEKQMNQAKKSFQVGTVTIADVNDALAAFDSSSAQEIQAENDLIYKKNIFQNLTGLDPNQIQILKDNINLELPKPQGADSWAKTAKLNNLSIKIADKQLAMANQDVDIAVSGHLPTLNLTGNYNYQDSVDIDRLSGAESIINNVSSIPGTPLSNYTTASIGATATLPIYSGGGVSAKVRQARANYQVAAQQLVGVERQTDQNTRNVYWQVENGVGIVNAQKTALKSAKTKLDSDQLGYQVGIRNSVDLVNSQRNYYQTFQTYQQSRYQYLLARIQLRYLNSDIDEKFIQDINTNIKQGS